MRTSPAKVSTPSPKSIPSTSVAPRHAHGLFTRIKGLVLRTKQEPLDLARRLIHNAWAIGIAKLGGMGWWLLVEEVPAPSRDWHYLSPKPRSRSSHESCQPSNDIVVSPPRTVSSRTGYSTPDTPRRRKATESPTSRHEPHLVPCPECEQPSSKRTFRLWFRFSLAIVLAIGLAIKDGPGSMLDEHHASAGSVYESWQSTPPKIQSTTEANAQEGLLDSTHGPKRNTARSYQTVDYGTIGR
ncbi:hypothetical protein XPA_005811 [Xanthoria parietina]